ncbi:STAS-like domain-containing protein [Methylomonas sp. ZR1]|uniref:STAS-like domain-containing protein n=1 Tax=Methylomonas sp. ZR1 TaxID=1797072 RepID=UPI001492F9A7|nr:STAS-like domain-containing protein [Methylomonas sp. ZR1]NOV31463.1 DUF4325 domain-containing protein [Methylomonas sp. ZR1]
MRTINIAIQFSRYPAGRVPEDGPFSGARFRDEWLIPILKDGEKAIIEMDGTRGYGSSFLEEAFGGLVRQGYTEDQVQSAFELHSSDPSIVEEVNEYITHGSDGATD